MAQVGLGERQRLGKASSGGPTSLRAAARWAQRALGRAIATSATPTFPARTLPTVTALTLTLTALSPAAATTMEQYGFGPRALALGNAAEAATDDFYALHANPANLVLASHIHLGLGADLVANRFAVERQGGADRWPTRLPKDNYLLHVGISTPLPGWLEGKAAMGVAFHIPMGGPTRLDSLDHRVPQLPMYDTLGDRLALLLGAAVRPLPWLTLGASAQVLTALSGGAEVGLSLLDKRVTYKTLQVELATEVYPILAATWLPRDDLRVALVWRKASQVKYGLPLAVEVEGVGRMDFAVSGVGLWLPDSWTLASSWQGKTASGKRILATAALCLQRWSELPPLAPDVTLRLDDSQLAAPGTSAKELLYAHNEPIAVGARDILIPRIGAEYSPGETWTLRTGGQWRPTPLPRADGEANYLDAPALTWAIGAGASFGDPLKVFRKPLQVDLTLAWTGLQRRTVTKLDPADPVGGTSVSGNTWHLSAAVHHDF